MPRPKGASAAGPGTPSGPRSGRRRDRVLDLGPPEWLVELVRARSGPIPWLMMARTGLSVPAGLAVGLATGHPAQGTAATLGAMATALVDRGGPLRRRLLRQLCGFGGGAIGMVAGHEVSGTSAWPILVFGVLAAVSGLVSSVNGAASVGGLQLLVQAGIATGTKLPLPTWQLPLWAACGSGWTLLLTTLTAFAVGLRTPEREAVATAYEQIAELLGAVGSRSRQQTVQARQELTDAVNAAYDALIGARSRTAGRSRELRMLASLLNGIGPLLDAVVGVAHTERPAPPGYRRCAGLIAEAIRDGGRPPRLPTREAAPPGEEWPQEERLTVRELRTALGGVLDLLGPDDPDTRRGVPLATPLTVRERLVALADRVLTGPQTWLYVARLTLCVAVAETLRTQVTLERSYWMVLTVAIVMKPDFGSVFVRGMQRGLGTAVGVLIGGGLLMLHPPAGLVVALMVAITGLFPFAQNRNYGMFTTLITPFALLLVDTAHPAGRDIVTARLTDTLLGVAICLVLGHLLWPETWRPLVGRRLADAADAVAAYVRTTFAPHTGRAARGAARRRAYRRLSDVRTELQRTIAEPPALKRRTTAWWPMLVQLERITDATTYTAGQLRGRKEEDTVDPEEAGRLTDAAEDLAQALHEHRAPRSRLLPADTGQQRMIGRPVPPQPGQHEDPLELVARELRTARRLATGPGRAGSRPPGTGTHGAHASGGADDRHGAAAPPGRRDTG